MIKNFIQAARLRTLPLSISGILLGSFLAFSQGYLNYTIFILALCTTIGFQVLSNFANDYGDGVKGTDNKNRIGPKRAIQTGAITKKQMLIAIISTATLTFFIALALIYVSFGKKNFIYSITFLILGALSIVAAIKYTMGKNAYGYSGLGDVFVFLFFGLLSVCGSYFLYTKHIDYKVFLPAISIGLLSVGVLNLNNMRDIENDKNSNKNTIVVKIGSKKAKQYHNLLVIGSFITMLIFSFLNDRNFFNYVYILAFLPIFLHLKRVNSNSEPRLLDTELKKLALSTFLLAILFGISRLLG